MDDLAELAARWGIDLEFLDARGRRQSADPEAVGRIAAALAAAGPPATAAAAIGEGRPERAWQGPDHSPAWILAVQLYGVRSRSNWGHGDFGDLAGLLRLAAEIGAAGIGLNPLHMLFPDRPEQASPYAPNSRLFINPLYIDMAAVAGAAGSGLGGELDRLRGSEMVDYTGVARAKISALRRAYERFRRDPQPGQRRDFEAFRHERGPALERFACFETLRRRFEGPWWEWPAEWRRPAPGALAALREAEADEVGLHEFMQWIADRQLRHCAGLARSLGLAVGLYIDLAVGVDAGGADAWAGQDTMLTGLSVGAPPDLLNTAGQDWGVTSYNPHRLLALAFEPWREQLAATMRHAGAIRLDHILGLKRLYVIPHGLGAARGAYLAFPFEAMLAVIAQESLRHRCIVIGEDLGTVPEGFRQTLSDWGLWSYLVMLFEREHDGSFRPPERYPQNALATFSTHDLPTFAGWMSGHDLAVKRAIGLDPGETDDERHNARAALHDALARRGHDQHSEGFAAIARYLAATPSRLVSVAIEDVLGDCEQVNVPGTVDQHPNWRRRLAVSVEDLTGDERVRRVAAAFAQGGRAGPTFRQRDGD
ncbi:MAG: 4-alpha-glucanotransferase [Alphaproteobacteria bacterium]|nr:4-alpha-glucanotransferase [Alphaproteobacteria bacterium]